MGERKRGETEERTVGDQLSFVRMYTFMYTLELMTAREKKVLKRTIYKLSTSEDGFG